MPFKPRYTRMYVREIFALRIERKTRVFVRPMETNKIVEAIRDLARRSTFEY